MDRLAKWRFALTNVTNLPGYLVCKNMSEADIINKVVDEVLVKINPMTLEVAKYPVGLDSRIKGVTSLLSSETEGVIRIGIHGMGGVGKTTIAKAVYNQNYQHFQGSCFLENVRHVLEEEEGLVCLQQQLINDVLKCKSIHIDNIDQGIELIRAKICLTKVLIVIDDLDDPIPLEFLEGPFALGSIIIITARNEDLLDSIKVEARYKVNELGEDESRQLFSQHAFGTKKIPDTYMELSRDILECAGGLPLALKSFGSNFLNQSEEGRICIDKLKRTSIDDVEKILRISFDALNLVDPMLQDIFLDIACFFIGQKRKEVAKIMETCYSFVNYNIDFLKKRCLLTINEGDELGMHDLLRNMGRDIARSDSPDDPGKHSRLWVSKDISYILKNHKGTEAIEGIMPDNFNYKDALDGESFSTKVFKRMRKLRFLYLKNVNLTGSFRNRFEDLRFLCWKCCPLLCLPSEFNPQKLVILELPNSKMRTMWGQNMVSQVFEKLKILNMSYSDYLITTPDFNKLPCLETLNLECCKRLEEIHASIGCLERLVSFNLHGCLKLRSLPESLCNLRALKSLNIIGCTSLEALPVELGNIKSLEELYAGRLSVWKLPGSMEHLSKLVELKLSNCPRFKTLPDVILSLKALKVLNIRRCKSLKALPTELGNIGSLEKLNVEGLPVSNFPDSIGRLSKLVDLRFSFNTKLKFLPHTICKLTALEGLHIQNCRGLVALPVELGHIESLKELNAEGLAVSKLPNSIRNLSKLVSLRLSRNKNLKTLPDTICHLISLEILAISGCQKLEILPNELWNISSLRELDASGTTLLKELPDIASNKSALSLRKLDLSGSGITALPSGISQLRNLENLNIKDCLHLLLIEELPLNLKRVVADGCTSLKRILDLSNLKKLEVLGLTNCSGLIKIIGLEELTSIRSLGLGGCRSSLLSYTFTERFFKIYCGFGHEIKICTSAARLLSINQSSKLGSAVCLDLMPNISKTKTKTKHDDNRYSGHLQPKEEHNFMAMIICFTPSENNKLHGLCYNVKTTRSYFSGRDSRLDALYKPEAVIVIVPRSIFLVREGDHEIKLTVRHAEILGMHLLYKTDIISDEYIIFDEYDSKAVSVRDGKTLLIIENLGWMDG